MIKAAIVLDANAVLRALSGKQNEAKWISCSFCRTARRKPTAPPPPPLCHNPPPSQGDAMLKVASTDGSVRKQTNTCMCWEAVFLCCWEFMKLFFFFCSSGIHLAVLGGFHVESTKNTVKGLQASGLQSVPSWFCNCSHYANLWGCSITWKTIITIFFFFSVYMEIAFDSVI